MGAGKGGGESGLTNPSSALVSPESMSAFQQQRAGEQGAYMAADPMGETTGQSTFASSLSPGATSAVPGAAVAAGTTDGGFSLSPAAKEALLTSMMRGGGSSPSGFSMPSSVGQVSAEQPSIQVPALRFALTPGQSRIMARMGLADARAREFLVNQVLSGNPAYGPYTVQQVQAARSMIRGGA